MNHDSKNHMLSKSAAMESLCGERDVARGTGSDGRKDTDNP